MEKDTVIITISNHTYKIVSNYQETGQILYRVFSVYGENRFLFEYRLGVTKLTARIYHLDPKKWLYEQGIHFVMNMLQTNRYKESGLITIYEISNNNMDWQKLKPLILNDRYFH